jgi:hypothetical protein
MPCLAPVPKIAQSDVVNRFIKNVFHFCGICQIIFVAKIIKFLCPTFACYLVMPRCTFGELITIL